MNPGPLTPKADALPLDHRVNCENRVLTKLSQIKLTTYDFSDLQITGEFDNRPGTGRFLRIFSCVVTYRTCGGRRLYMISSTDARCLDGIVRHQPDNVQCLADFTRKKHFFTCNDEYNNIEIRHHSSKETGC